MTSAGTRYERDRLTSIVDLVVLKRQKALTVGMEMAADAVCADLAKGFRFRAAWVVFERRVTASLGLPVFRAQPPARRAAVVRDCTGTRSGAAVPEHLLNLSYQIA